jgi:hypothetical protein
MLKPLILQTAESTRVSLNEPLMSWLQGHDRFSVCAAKAATQAEWCATLERIARMPPVPGDPSMQLLAKLALLSAASAALEAELQQAFPAFDVPSNTTLQNQILRECARAWVYAERESPATYRFTVRMKTMEDALRLQCGLAGLPPAHDDIELPAYRRIA